MDPGSGDFGHRPRRARSPARGHGRHHRAQRGRRDLEAPHRHPRERGGGACFGARQLRSAVFWFTLCRLLRGRASRRRHAGEVSERSKEHAWKVCVRLKGVPWVRIPPSPPIPSPRGGPGSPRCLARGGRQLWWAVLVPPRREVVNPVRPGREQRQQRSGCWGVAGTDHHPLNDQGSLGRAPPESQGQGAARSGAQAMKREIPSAGRFFHNL